MSATWLVAVIAAASGCGDDDADRTPLDAGRRDVSVSDSGADDAAVDGGSLPCDPGETGCWVPLSTTEAPEPRALHTAVWTGEEMVVWTGTLGNPKLGYPASGGAYAPVSDTWSPTASTAKLELYGRISHVMVWTGTEALVWGGSNEEGDDQGPWQQGGRYNSEEDEWSLMTIEDVPLGRMGPSAVWTGSEMVIWGGFSPSASGQTATGGRYAPAEDEWQATSTEDAPSARSDHTAVWTGDAMIVWGGVDETTTIKMDIQTGGAYDPVADEWTPTETDDAPAGRRNHTAVWTGSEMIVWGGWTYADVALDTGGRYDADADTWDSTSTTDTPQARFHHTAVWTGSRMIVWGGQESGAESFFGDGAMYDPATDTWTPMATENAPSPRTDHTAVWTGSAMIVWGGRDENGVIGTGAAFYPPR